MATALPRTPCIPRAAEVLNQLDQEWNLSPESPMLSTLLFGSLLGREIRTLPLKESTQPYSVSSHEPK